MTLMDQPEVAALPPQHAIARDLANKKRRERAFYRECVLDGRLSIGELFMDPPPALAGMTLVGVMGLTRRSRSFAPWQQRVGRRAVLDGVNLLQPVDRASEHSRRWCARNAPRPRVEGRVRVP